MKQPRPRVSVLGTLAEFHHGAVAFDLKALVDLVVEVSPDLLCLDIEPTRWHQRDFDDLPPEYSQALLPLAERSDIVVVPIGDQHSLAGPAATGWRLSLVRWLRRRLAALQRRAPSPAAANYGWRHDLANLIYAIMDALDSRKSAAVQRTHAAELTENIKRVANHDPAADILAVVNVRYCHRIRPALAAEPEIELVSFQKMRGK
jgi:hypothetical protein